jgi:hypothetical protein
MSYDRNRGQPPAQVRHRGHSRSCSRLQRRASLALLLLASACAPDQFVSMGYDVQSPGRGTMNSSGGTIADSGAVVPGGSCAKSETAGAGHAGELPDAGDTPVSPTNGGASAGGASNASTDFGVRRPL